MVPDQWTQPVARIFLFLNTMESTRIDRWRIHIVIPVSLKKVLNEVSFESVVNEKFSRINMKHFVKKIMKTHTWHRLYIRKKKGKQKIFPFKQIRFDAYWWCDFHRGLHWKYHLVESRAQDNTVPNRHCQFVHLEKLYLIVNRKWKFCFSITSLTNMNTDTFTLEIRKRIGISQ